MSNYQDPEDVQYNGIVSSVDMPFARSDMTANTFPYDFGIGDNERIYLIGGCVKDQLCVYNNGVDDTNGVFCYCPTITAACNFFIPQNETWHSCKSAPRQRYRHMAALVNNKIYVAGGRALTPPFNDTLITEIDVYDPITDSWSTPYIWTDATSDGSAFGVGNLLYLVGGYNSDYSESAGKLTTLNVVNGTWDFSLPSMNFGRGDTSIATIDDKSFYIIGGWVAPVFCNASKSVEIFNTETNEWTTLSSLLYARGDPTTGSLGGYVFSIGGEIKEPSDPTCSYSDPVASVSRYNPDTNQWQIEASLPEDIFRFKSGISYNTSVERDSRAIYLFGGQGNYRPDSMVYPVKNSTLKYVPYFLSHPSSSKPKLSDGGIAGIVIGGFVFLLICVIIIVTYFSSKYYYKKTPSQSNDENASEHDVIQLRNGAAVDV